MEKTTMRKQQSEETKRRIFEKSIQLVKARGYNNVTLEEICRECDITKGAFYHHFSSKKDIILGISMNLDYDIVDYYENELCGMDYLSRIKKIMLYYCRFMEEIGVDILRQIVKILSDGESEQLISFDRYTSRILQDTIRDGVEKGEIRCDFPIESIFYLLHHIALGITLDWCSAGGGYSLLERGEISLCGVISLLKK